MKCLHRDRFACYQILGVCADSVHNPMGQDLSRDETGKRGFALFSRTEYADRNLGVKRPLRFWHVISSIRTRNDHNLPSVAKIVTLASIGRGFAEGSQHLSVAMRLASPYRVVVEWMKEKFDDFAEKQRRIVRSCLSFSCAFDNWQKFVRNKFQRGHNAAGEERVGTTRFFRRNFEQEWPPETVLSGPSGESATIVSTKSIDLTHTSIEYNVVPVGLLHGRFSHQHRLAAEVESARDC